MTIEIHRPELEALILQRMKHGGFHNVEDALMQALQTSSLVNEDEDKSRAEQQPSAGVGRPLQTAADIVLSHMRNVPAEIMATMPKDGASQHDHYIYGNPKRAE
jgi:hypothetical protein